MPTADPYNLQRFVDAQQFEYGSACSELSNGHKDGHWIWYIFPQLQGLGQSQMSQRYGISSLKEAEAYVAHPILGPRLREITKIVNAVEGQSIHQIFGNPDNLKFHSSMTLFSRATPDNQEFKTALRKYFAGPDSLTLKHLGLIA